MKKRRRRFRKIDFKKLFDRKLIPIYAVVFAVILALVLVLNAGGSSGVKRAEDTSFAGRNTIYVGLVCDNNPLVSADENESFSGYDVDVITEILSRAYPDKKIVFKRTDSQIASYSLKTGEINLAIGLFTKGITKTQGLAISKGYYTDDVCVYVAADSKITDINELRSKTVLAMTTEVSRSAIKKQLDSIEGGVNMVECSSYGDAFEDISNGRANAIIAPRQMMKNRADGLRELPSPLLTADYCIISWTDNTSVTSYLNNFIAQMKEDGALSSLEKKYGIYIQPEEEEK